MPWPAATRSRTKQQLEATPTPSLPPPCRLAQSKPKSAMGEGAQAEGEGEEEGVQVSLWSSTMPSHTSTKSRWVSFSMLFFKILGHIQTALCRDAKCYFFAIFCTVFGWKYLKNTAGFRKYCFAVSLLLHMYVYGTIDENIVFSFKILFFFQP